MIGIIFKIIVTIILIRILVKIIKAIVSHLHPRRVAGVIRDSMSSRTDLRGRYGIHANPAAVSEIASGPVRAPVSAPAPAAQPVVSTVSAADARFKTQTGDMIYFANDSHGMADTQFNFNYCQLQNDNWRAYITRMPNLNGREASGTITHRLWDGDKPYVCWNTPIDNLKDMQNVSKFWADCVLEYIATGKHFGPGTE